MSGEGVLRSLPGSRRSLFERMREEQRFDDEVETRADPVHDEKRS
jgi:hypothetical protein